ncbi:ribonuclease D [Gilvimarinus sp. SDUM040013]|uniref:Ribonuclease D n=1 Tax=Gilvimarinus gilvus TaxID=3058038 RepID=A0ABU4RTE5_9GAMM|nr:ribonuclease D [Gilvimarinus sp. SDUM040013]MDO3386946.1 ribonuclease D [Gilvimarinus sp. SDUM040013]MDX6848160.1 ribonuclease D [Gilvimarinus sp. SDUM040013]
MQIPTQPIWVEDANTLRELCRKWSEQAAIAVDTEFMRSDTFYPIAGLIQVGDGEGCYLIDPVAIDDLSALAQLWRDESVTKVLHACSEDLEVFNVRLGAVPSPLFDTQIAAAYAGYGFSLGYANLVREMLGVEIPKGETRSDWLARPLSLAQKDYAALDVAHLLIVYGKLLQTLRQQERLDWVKSDCAELVAAAGEPVDAGSAYLKVGLGWKLPERGVAALKLLAEWREVEARARDIPRNRLMKEQPLFEIARRLPDSMGQLQRIEGIPRRTLHDDGDFLLGLVARACALDEDELPNCLTPPLGREFGSAIKAMKAWVRVRAEELGVPAEILIRKKEYEHIIRSVAHGTPELPGRLNGWRADLIGQSLLKIAIEQVAEVS